MIPSPNVKAPFPYFGKKRAAAPLIWERLGDPNNYLEPFGGSLEVLLSRPTPPRIETVNDLDALLTNFWRAVSHDPQAVARHAVYPVSEIDLNARHRWLIGRKSGLLEALRDPLFYDPQAAGWWVWGANLFMGGHWGHDKATPQMPKLSRLAGGLTNFATGSLKSLDEATALLMALQKRLRNVRITCGDFRRLLTPALTTAHSRITAVLLDPPYAAPGAENDVYAVPYDPTIPAEVREWAAANGHNPRLRICLAGYDGEHNALEELGWVKVRWGARRGYQALKEGAHNGQREALWFSPHCLNPQSASQALSLFDFDFAQEEA